MGRGVDVGARAHDSGDRSDRERARRTIELLPCADRSRAARGLSALFTRPMSIARREVELPCHVWQQTGEVGERRQRSGDCVQGTMSPNPVMLLDTQTFTRY